MSESIVTRADGTRLVTRDTDGAKWIEKDKDNGVVERTYIAAPLRNAAGLGSAVVSGTASPPRATPTTTTKPKRKQSRRVPIRSMDGPPCDVEVLLGDGVIESICRGLCYTTGADGKEAGGWLAGFGVENTVAVLSASSPNDTDPRTATSVSLNDQPAKNYDKMRQSGDTRACIGVYHSHPNGDPTPSQQDFKSWESCLEHANRNDDWQPYTVGIIAVPDERSEYGRWASPSLYAWVTRYEHGGYVTQPATIKRLSDPR